MDFNETKKRLLEIKNFRPYEKFQETWITEGINEEAIKFASNFGLFLCDLSENNKNNDFQVGRNALTNSQIRNVFGEVKRIQMKVSGNEEKWNNVKSSFLLLQPKLAYASGRVESKNRNSVLPILKDVLISAAQAVNADKSGAVNRYNNFVDFLESILAYHKANGGKD